MVNRSAGRSSARSGAGTASPATRVYLAPFAAPQQAVTARGRGIGSGGHPVSVSRPRVASLASA